MANFIGVDLYGQQTIDVQDTAARLELPNKADKDLYNVDPADVFSKIPMDTTIDSSATNSKLPTTKAAYDAITTMSAAKDLSNVDTTDFYDKIPREEVILSTTAVDTTFPTTKAVYDVTRDIAGDVQRLDLYKADMDLANVDEGDLWYKMPKTTIIDINSTDTEVATAKSIYLKLNEVINNLKLSYASLKVATKINASQDTPADLNEYTTPGNYTVNTDTIAGYVTNNPRPTDPSAFKLFVLNKEDTVTVIIQIVMYYLRPYAYIRWSSDSGSTWGSWKALNNVQANWSQNDNTADDYIQNKPDALTASQIISLSGSDKYMVSPTALRNGIMGVSNPFKTSPITLISAGQNEINSKSIKRLWKVVTLPTTIAPNGTADFHLSELESATTIFEAVVIGRDSSEEEQAPLRITKIGMANHADDGDIFIANTSDITVNSVLVYVDYSE